MISDVLREAAYEIRRYLNDQPSMYAEDKDAICRLLSEMDSVLKILNTHPVKDSQERASLRESVLAATRAHMSRG